MSVTPELHGNWRVYRYQTIDSTNLEALRLARREALAWTAVRADTQTGGRGRLGRSWSDTPGGSLLLTALVDRPRGLEALLAPAMAMACAEALETMGAPQIAVKWPNDLLLAGRKIKGVLTEGPAEGLFAVGIGVNANGRAADLPEELQGRATFVSEQLGREVDLDLLADGLLECFERHHHALLTGRPGPVVEALRARDCLTGREVSVRSGGDTIEGIAEGWTDDGRLAIIDRAGNRVVLDAGEVTLS
ncbi:MAG TPA: biotin--[acetyl-CoA-carboxylase] ligase [Armatimonadetes bacterium]|nr:biotin--[acetyl-CoA-carboxylase] ligase [Armatimonadota bacterium]